MSMLAEPRRKQKVINLRAKNSAWSNDKNKFGQRMLEKMGWSSGKGLGAKENGIVEHVVARYKNDEKGLGFEDKNDQWTKHEDDFNALLANLSNGDSNEEKLHSGISLEVKSKKSKTRVHYHKFTRGKDLTRYSEKDLANIFGKKTLKNVVEKEEILKDEVKTTEQIFTEKGSMEDYFKNKLLALKSKVSFNKVENETDEADFVFKGFAGTRNDVDTPCDTGFQGFSFYGSNTENPDNNTDSCNKNANNNTENCSEESKKIKKKKKKKDKSDKPNEEEDYNQNIKDSAELAVDKKKKSKNKHKINSDEVGVKDEIKINTNEAFENEMVPLKRKKSKKQNKTEEVIVETTEVLVEDSFVPKKKKKRKYKNNES